MRREADVMDDREDMHEPAILVGLVTCVVWFVADKMPYVQFF